MDYLLSEKPSLGFGPLACLVFTFEIVWQILGSVWLYRSDDCTAALWGMTLFLAITWYVKVTVVLLFTALVCLPLPVLLKVMRYSPLTQRNPASEVVVTQTEIAKITEVEQTEKSEECPICLRAMEMGSRVGRLPCGDRHLFHKECVLAWVRVDKRCPICRMLL